MLHTLWRWTNNIRVLHKKRRLVPLLLGDWVACRVSYSGPEMYVAGITITRPILPPPTQKKRSDVSNFDPFCGRQRELKRKGRKKSNQVREGNAFANFCSLLFYLLNNVAYHWVENGKAKHHQCRKARRTEERKSQRLRFGGGSKLHSLPTLDLYTNAFGTKPWCNASFVGYTLQLIKFHYA